METLEKYSFIKKEDNIFISKSIYPPDLGIHAHNFLEIVYIYEGNGTHSLNDRDFKVTAGDLFLLDYNDAHTFKNVSPDFTIITCAFLPQLIDDSLVHSDNAADILGLLLFKPFFEEDADLRFSINLMNRRKEFERLFDEMYMEFANKETSYQAVIKGYLIILLSRVFRFAMERKAEGRTKQDMEIIQKAIGYLKENYSRPFRVEDIARSSFLSPGYFAAVFKNETGSSLTDYLQKVRISEACRLLEATDKSVQEIICEVGYSDSKFFYNIFKRHTGMTPGEYRKHLVCR